mgnify:CR=1 FL=1
MKNEKAKHTPGPWKAYGQEVQGDLNGKLRRVAYCNMTESGKVTTRIQAEANARLIAAAPDLLAALEKCAAMLANIGQGATNGDYLDALGEARAAIAKTEAGQ